MKTALFTNFSEETFTGYWNGKGKTFKPGQSVYMPNYLAEHFAKHLVNRELLRLKADGTPVYKDGEKMTSPKKPQDVPLYMELFNKAYTPDDEEPMMQEGDEMETAIDTANKNRQKRDAESAQSPDEPQIIMPPEDDEDEEGDESSFGGAPATGQAPAGLSL